MKFIFFKILLVLIIFSGCSTVQTEDRSNFDFNFSLEYGVFGVCHVSIINTENMTYTRKDTKEGDISIALPMTEMQIDTVRQMMNNMNFLKLPPVILGSSASVSNIYTFQVKNGSLEKILRYESDGSENTNALDSLCSYIIKSINSNSEIKKLPAWKNQICH